MVFLARQENAAANHDHRPARESSRREYRHDPLLRAPRVAAARIASRVGYREYEADDVARLSFIRRAKDLGFSLAYIAELLSLSHDRRDVRGVKRKAEEHLADVERKIAELKRVQRGLKTLIDACPGHGDLATCPIVAALTTGIGKAGR
jgi:MerR family copper efflux transcriptional regulator